MKPPRRLTLLAALCHVRQTEITDSLVDLFIVLKINTRPEWKVDKELNAELKKIRGKEGMLEVSMLALHLVQSALVHVNTLLMQEVLADPKWADKLTDADRRALSPLFRTHVNPYGRFELDMNSRLDLDLSIRATVPGPRTLHGEAASIPV
ncbi:Tn3 family transposase [Streptomyces goshikiensis]|uniref:Tn3 family transposase n=1 Tax=Streptomyces goshikiensis TaxID=1942 RepID=UPI00369A99EF